MTPLDLLVLSLLIVVLVAFVYVAFRRLERNRREVGEQISVLSRQVNGLGEQLGRDIETLSNRTGEVSLQVGAAEAVVTGLREQLRRDFETLSADLSVRSGTAEAVVIGLREELRRGVETLSNRTGDLSVRVGGAEAAVTGLREGLGRYIETLSNQTGDLSARVGAAEAAVTGLQEQLERDIGTLSNRTDDLSVRVAGAKAAVTSLKEQLGRDIETLSNRTGDLGVRVGAAEEAMTGLKEEIGHDVEVLQTGSGNLGIRVEAADAVLRRLRTNVAEVADGISALARRASDRAIIEDSTLAAKTETELVAMAESVVVVRPLVPYPHWRFDVDWANPDAAFELRQRIWQQFHGRRLEIPIKVAWYYGLRLLLYLGNDLSRQIFVGGSIDPNELAFLDRFLEPGMTFVDAGANEGIYTIFAARRVGPEGSVWAIEPSQRELERLHANLSENALDVSVFPSALAEFSGEAELTIAGYEHEGQNTLGAFAYQGVEAIRKETVPVTTLDDLVARMNPNRIDMVKMDVEGAEYRAIRGATSTLERFHPILMLEASDRSLEHQGATRHDLLRALEHYGYTVYGFDRLSGLPVQADPDSWSSNVLGIPASYLLPSRVRQVWPV